MGVQFLGRSNVGWQTGGSYGETLRRKRIRLSEFGRLGFRRVFRGIRQGENRQTRIRSFGGRFRRSGKRQSDRLVGLRSFR